MSDPFSGLNDAFGTEPSELQKHVEKTKELLKVLIDKIPETKSCNCEKALSEAEF